MWTVTILLGELWSLLCSVQSWDFLPSVTENLRQPPLWAHAQALFLLCAPSLCLLLLSCQDPGRLNIPQVLQLFHMSSSEASRLRLPSYVSDDPVKFLKNESWFSWLCVREDSLFFSVSTFCGLKLRSNPEPLEWEHWLQDPKLPEN